MATYIFIALAVSMAVIRYIFELRLEAAAISKLRNEIAQDGHEVLQIKLRDTRSDGRNVYIVRYRDDKKNLYVDEYFCDWRGKERIHQQILRNRNDFSAKKK